MLRETLQSRSAGVPGKYSATAAIQNELREVAKLQRTLIKDHHVTFCPQSFPLGRDLVGAELLVAEEPIFPYPGNNHAPVVGRVQIRQKVLKAGLMKHDRMAPYRMAIPIEFLKLHIAGIPKSRRPSHHDPAIASTGDFRSEMLAAIAGELHAAGSPSRITGLVHLGGRHLLILSFTRIQKRQQRIASNIDIQAVVLGGAVAQIGDHVSIMRELFYASGIQPL